MLRFCCEKPLQNHLIVSQVLPKLGDAKRVSGCDLPMATHEITLCEAPNPAIPWHM